MRVGGERRPIEWPTVALAGVIYGGWLTVTYWSAWLPWWLTSAAGAWLVAWHSSLQHEILHGHPTRWIAVNRALGLAPLALWLPYDSYRTSHLTHHNDERLTDPLDDPESRYWDRADWDRLGLAGQLLVRAQATLLGRLTIGPFWVISVFLWNELRGTLSGDSARHAIWLQHAAGVAAVLAWLVLVCGMSPGFYALAIAVPATSLMLIRSFAEHRAADTVERRTAIVEGTGPLALLFLFNNLHAAHHERPSLPWYEIPAWYRANRDRLIEANGGLVYQGYGEVFRRFLFSPHDQPLHPLGRAPARRPARDDMTEPA